ncbi:TetR/AcrR family transcriptional regulator [Clostridium sp. PL3]|uniref:TetR/AcrR family transcriptional regulator n=1 Tax=Clostridium thailandense TaxID=2794346 RepID=A0A949TSZ7_9CLOT|nr:TetR/AcrR family transcriptional regulator [Clostridium thailandense]MBV7271778.1 TetR/AcrR family transcriptional regulator [Clostridium thailandense]
MENATRDKIFYTSFRLFLENGYEATNIRDICREVGVKASTVYFYYKSKQDLFFYIYDNIRNDYINYIRSIEALNQDISIKDKLCILLKKKIEYYASDISKRKFVLRCHLFPPEEISNVIREKYRLYTSKENKIILDIIGNPQYDDKFINENIDNYLLKLKHLENNLVYEMATSTIKISDGVVEKIWDIYFDLM